MYTDVVVLVPSPKPRVGEREGESGRKEGIPDLCWPFDALKRRNLSDGGGEMNVFK